MNVRIVNRKSMSERVVSQDEAEKLVRRSRLWYIVWPKAEKPAAVSIRIAEKPAEKTVGDQSDGGPKPKTKTKRLGEIFAVSSTADTTIAVNEDEDDPENMD